MGNGSIMAVDSTNKKLGVMEWCSIWEPGLPISPGTLGQDDQQQLLQSYPGVLFSTLTLSNGSTSFNGMWLFLDD